MAPLFKHLAVTLLSGFALQSSATPVASPKSQYARHALHGRANLQVRATTTTDTTTIDWVSLNSQAGGNVASPPPDRAVYAGNLSKPLSELQLPGAALGPPGTVPIPQVSLDYLENVANKAAPEIQSSKSKAKRQYSGNHWYSSSNLGIANIGGSAIYSVFKAFVNNNADFSLLQTAVVKMLNGNIGQTLEAGWINYPNQVAAPHLFTYYTTNGYSQSGNNLGGWNRDVAGWVQYDSAIFPGTVFTPNSVDGGAQYELEIKYLLYQGNWWLWVLDRWIGYYPASLFSASQTGANLATGSDMIFYYGEIFQAEGPLTTTDMGSGEFGASNGFGKAAYIHNMLYTDASGNDQVYTPSFWDSDSSRYNHQNVINSGGSWGSYVYLGGPGAGGVVNG